MKKLASIIAYTLPFVLGLILPSVVFASAPPCISASGFGNSNTNGVYSVVGTYGGDNLYQNSNGVYLFHYSTDDWWGFDTNYTLTTGVWYYDGAFPQTCFPTDDPSSVSCIWYNGGSGVDPAGTTSVYGGSCGGGGGGGGTGITATSTAMDIQTPMVVLFMLVTAMCVIMTMKILGVFRFRKMKKTNF